MKEILFSWKPPWIRILNIALGKNRNIINVELHLFQTPQDVDLGIYYEKICSNFHSKKSWMLNRSFGKWYVTKTWSTGYPNLVVVFARHLLIKDYSNEYTRNQVENHKQTTLILLYPEAHQDLGKGVFRYGLNTWFWPFPLM